MKGWTTGLSVQRRGIYVKLVFALRLKLKAEYMDTAAHYDFPINISGGVNYIFL